MERKGEQEVNVMSEVIFGVPLFVVAIVSLAARREHRVSMPFPSLLAFVTVLAWVAAAFVPVSLLAAGAFSLVLFFTLGMRALARIERVSRAALPASVTGERSASLIVRGVGDHLPLALRVAAFVLLACAALVFTTQVRIAHVPLLLPVAYAAVSVVFFTLYEIWMRDEALAEHARRAVRSVFAAQCVLSASFIVLAFVALRTGPTAALAVTSALIGFTGCALAISSGVRARYLRLTRVRNHSPV
jgi:hypothetical protein